VGAGLPQRANVDAETIEARILEAVPPEKADTIAAAINQRLVSWRVGTLGPRRWPLAAALGGEAPRPGPGWAGK
jgi:hypothetical protein